MLRHNRNRLILVWAVLLLGLFGFQRSCHASYADYATYMEAKYQIEPGLLKGICYVESHYKHPTRGGAHGEVGICQIKPDTVRDFCPSCEKNIGNLHQGMRSNTVKEIQKVLGLRQDGVFGLKTHLAVTLFQESKGLMADGIVGPKTRKALFGVDQTNGSLEEQLRDPLRNIEYAARYLVHLREKLGTDDRDILAAAYNGGRANGTVKYMLRVRNAPSKRDVR